KRRAPPAPFVPRLTAGAEVGFAAGRSVVRADTKTPFPIPAGLAQRNCAWNPVYDLVIVSDLSLLGGTRRCNEGYVAAATALGLRVGLFHWPRHDLKLKEIAATYWQLSCQSNVDILVPEDVIDCDTVIIHHPPILKHRIDAVPRITCERVGILVNQVPMQLRSEAPHYYSGGEAEAICSELFGHTPVWMPISPLTRRILSEIGGL